MNYSDFISSTEKKDLNFPIPTLGLRSFFWVKKEGESLRILSAGGKSFLLDEKVFEKTLKVFIESPINKRFRSSTYSCEQAYLVSFFRELKYRFNISVVQDKKFFWEEYIPSNWKGIAERISKLKSIDIYNCFISKKSKKYFEKTSKRYGCEITLLKDSLTVSKENSVCSLNLCCFEQIQKELIDFCSGITPLGLVKYIQYTLLGFSVYEKLKAKDYEALVECIGALLGMIDDDVLSEIIGEHFCVRSIMKFLCGQFCKRVAVEYSKKTRSSCSKKQKKKVKV